MMEQSHSRLSNWETVVAAALGVGAWKKTSFMALFL